MGYVTDTQDDLIGIETRMESFYLYGPGIFRYGDKSVELTYDILARLIFAITNAPDVQYAIKDHLNEALARVTAEHLG